MLNQLPFVGLIDSVHKFIQARLLKSERPATEREKAEYIQNKRAYTEEEVTEKKTTDKEAETEDVNLDQFEADEISTVFMAYGTLETLRWDIICVLKHSAVPRLDIQQMKDLTSRTRTQISNLCKQHHLRRNTMKNLVFSIPEVRKLLESNMDEPLS